MTIEQITNVLVTVTLIEMMVATGLGVTIRDLVAVARDWRLVGRAMIANYVLVPAATVGLLFLFKAKPMVAAGFLILAFCPGAPFGPPFTAVAKGNVPVAAGLMLILAASSALLAPLLLAAHLPLFAGEEELVMDEGKILITLLVTQLVPLGVGIAVRQARPALAARLQKPAGLVSKLLNLVVVVVVLATQGHLMTEIRVTGFVGMFVLLVASWAAGWLLGGRAPGERRAMTLTTSLRNVGVGMIIAAGAFPGTPALTAVLVYGLLGVIGSLLLALRWSRSKAAHETTAPEAALAQ